MKRIGFINANYHGEKRVALLPGDVKNINTFDEIYVQENYGKYVDISDQEYKQAGCIIVTREQIFEDCEVISHLKCIQKEDYNKVKKGTVIIGWTHPYGSGKECADVLLKNGVIIVDLDNIYPNLFYKDKKISLLEYIPKNFIKDNSLNAGRGAIIHAFSAAGIYPDLTLSVAVLSAGNVSQGALEVLYKFGCKVRIFTRSNMNEFQRDINEFDVIVNGIEFDSPNPPIINHELSKNIKKGALVIDAAADAGAVIEDIKFTSYEEPFMDVNGAKFWCINNIPSLFNKTASKIISAAFSKTYDINYKEILEKSLK